MESAGKPVSVKDRVEWVGDDEVLIELCDVEKDTACILNGR